MIELHCHTFFSDGVLSPIELIRRYVGAGYTAVALTDHADPSNIESIITQVKLACEAASRYWPIKALAGIELTHVPSELIPELVKRARALGAGIVHVHGETIVEPVEPGTNRRGIEAGIDFLAHPGLISEDDARLAAARGIPLEITTRAMHSYTNGHVVAMARKVGAALVINNDAHAPSDIRSKAEIINIARGAGLTDDEIKRAFTRASELFDTSFERSGSKSSAGPSKEATNPSA